MYIIAINGISGSLPTPPMSVGAAGHPTRLKSLEMYDCATLGEDIIRWLRNRIPEVKFSDPVSHRYAFRSLSGDSADL